MTLEALFLKHFPIQLRELLFPFFLLDNDNLCIKENTHSFYGLI